MKKKICVSICENDDIYAYEYNDECLNLEQYQNKLKTENISKTVEIEEKEIDNNTGKYSEVVNNEIIINSESSKNLDLDGTNIIKLTEETITDDIREKTDIIEKIQITNKISIEEASIENENIIETTIIIKKPYIKNTVDTIKI